MKNLPTFKYHPDPVATKVFERLNEVCDCCQQSSEYIYTPSVYCRETVSGLCPWCISSGRAHEKFDLVITPNVGVSFLSEEPWSPVPESVRQEIMYRTPGFAGYQEEHWWSHCGDGGAFLGYVGDLPAEVFAAPESKKFIEDMQRLHEISAEDWQWLIETPDREHAITFFVFRCLHCGEIGGYGDFT